MQENFKRTQTCWVITEGLIGTENQCVGVAQALGVTPKIKRITLRQPWKSLSPWFGLESEHIFIPALKDAHEDWPDILLTAGRKSIAAARFIKKQSGDKTFSVHLQNPRTAIDCFDLIAAPAHDKLRGDNVITTIAAPNRITADKLAQARTQFPAFEAIAAPRVAVLIGGRSRTYDLPPARLREICADLKKLNAGLMITTSRRTGAENVQILRDAFAGTSAWIWDGTGDNPYMGLLAWADYILVTADSTSMLSDACTTGKPTYKIPLTDKGTRRTRSLYEILASRCGLRDFEGTLETWDYVPLTDAQDVAREILRHMICLKN